MVRRQRPGRRSRFKNQSLEARPGGQGFNTKDQKPCQRFENQRSVVRGQRSRFQNQRLVSRPEVKVQTTGVIGQAKCQGSNTRGQWSHARGQGSKSRGHKPGRRSRFQHQSLEDSMPQRSQTRSRGRGFQS